MSQKRAAKIAKLPDASEKGGEALGSGKPNTHSGRGGTKVQKATGRKAGKGEQQLTGDAHVGAAGEFSPISLQLPGGAAAPRAARAVVLAGLRGHVNFDVARDAALVVGELVANSVEHADVGPTQPLSLDLRILAGDVWIAVGDRGSHRLPRITSREPEAPGGLGLRVVDRLARSWGVARNGIGRTVVWCRLALDPAGGHDGRY